MLLPVFAMLVIISSCKKNFLDRQPLGRYFDEDVPAGSFDSKVFATYSILRRGGFNHHLYLGIQSFRGDESMKGSDPGDGAVHEQMFDDFEYTASNGGLQEYWTDHYALIIGANEIISDIDSMGLTDPNTLVNRGEAKFLRAFAFFDLVRAFGGVPPVTFKVLDPAQVNIERATADEIFDIIDEDLAEAAGILPERWEGKYIGRLTSGAAKALQTRTYMWRSMWVQALASAKSVINSDVYGLVPNYGSQFRKEGENGPESIFEIQAFYTPTRDLGIIYSNVQGVRGAGNWDLGWGWNVPTQELVDEFEPSDPRRIETILYAGQTDPLYGETVPPASSVFRPYFNKKVYTNPADRTSNNNRFGPWMNHRIIRYADLLLMAAEAANEIHGAQDVTDALAWLEEVRARARGSNGVILPAVTTTDKDDLRDAIIHERMVELGMEEQRFFDLVRWKIDIDVLHAAGKAAYEAKHRLLPIPQGEIDKSGGVLDQNPGF